MLFVKFMFGLILEITHLGTRFMPRAKRLKS